MLNVSFSLTEQFVIHPALSLRAPTPEGAPLKDFLRGEILARIVAIATSLFAALDGLIHLGAGLVKGGNFLLRKGLCLKPTSSSREILGHFAQALKFQGIAMVGTLLGVFNPDLLAHFLYNPSAPDDEEEFPPSPSLSSASYDHLKEVWKKSSLEEKRAFVSHFNRQEHIGVRRHLGETVYRHVTTENSPVKWLSPQEISDRINADFEQKTRFPYFYHATSKAGLEGILTSQRIEVRHEKAFRGAFVSNRPELSFGQSILALNRRIERLSPLQHGFTIDRKTYWAGFSQSIPVTEKTLAYIIHNGDQQACDALAKDCLTLTGRNIKVIPFSSDGSDLCRRISNLGMGIPHEWRDESPTVGQKIFNVLQIPRTQKASLLARISVQLQRLIKPSAIQLQVARQTLRQVAPVKRQAQRTEVRTATTTAASQRQMAHQQVYA